MSYPSVSIYKHLIQVVLKIVKPSVVLKLVAFLLQRVLKLLPRCLAAAHTVLGVHPFSRLDVLIVPAGFSSLGMAR